MAPNKTPWPVILEVKLSQIRAANPQEFSRSACSEWWAVLGSNQWPLPCETGGRGLRIKDMRARTPFATGTWYHLMSFDITQCHFRSVPELSQSPQEPRGGGGFPLIREAIGERSDVTVRYPSVAKCYGHSANLLFHREVVVHSLFERAKPSAVHPHAKVPGEEK